jgi:hypothetical protein
MPIEPAFVLRCPKCADYTVLPHPTPQGKSYGLLGPSTDTWPIFYLCQKCGQMSGVLHDMIRPEVVETVGQIQLVRYDFANGLADKLQKFRIYSKEIDPFYIANPDPNRVIKRVLIPSKMWEDSFGTAVQELIEPIESFGSKF